MFSILQIKQYFAFIIIFLLIDLIWLKGARKLHLNTFQSVTGKKEMDVNIKAVILFYLIAPLGYFVFIHNKFDKKYIFFYGMLMGLLLYSTYDLTSKAIYNKNYSWTYTFTDILWGTFVYGITSYLVSKI